MFNADFSRSGLVIAIVLVAFSVGPFDPLSASADEIPENCLTPCAKAYATSQRWLPGQYNLAGDGYGGGPLGGTVVITLTLGPSGGLPVGDLPSLEDLLGQNAARESNSDGHTCAYGPLSTCAVAMGPIPASSDCVTAIVTTTDGAGPAQDSATGCAS